MSHGAVIMEWDGPLTARQAVKDLAGCARPAASTLSRSHCADLEQPLLCAHSPAGEGPPSHWLTWKRLDYDWYVCVLDATDNGLYPAGTKVRFVPPVELTLPQILQRMMGYNIVAVLNQFVTCAAFPGAMSTSFNFLTMHQYIWTCLGRGWQLCETAHS